MTETAPALDDVWLARSTYQMHRGIPLQMGPVR